MVGSWWLMVMVVDAWWLVIAPRRVSLPRWSRPAQGRSWSCLAAMDVANDYGGDGDGSWSPKLGRSLCHGNGVVSLKIPWASDKRSVPVFSMDLKILKPKFPSLSLSLHLPDLPGAFCMARNEQQGRMENSVASS